MIGLISEKFAELEMMKEKFAKLLLGEDMSGGGKGVCTAVTISNSITNLYGNSIIGVISQSCRKFIHYMSNSRVNLCMPHQFGPYIITFI